jgi:hypothetical protein
MSFAQIGSRPPIIDVVAEEVDAETLPRSKTGINREVARFGARLSELLTRETPHDLLGRLAEFKRSVDEPLRRASSAYQLLRQLEESGLKDRAGCTRELEARLATNPHYVVLRKIAEAERAIAEITATRL